MRIIEYWFSGSFVFPWPVSCQLPLFKQKKKKGYIALLMELEDSGTLMHTHSYVAKKIQIHYLYQFLYHINTNLPYSQPSK